MSGASIPVPDLRSLPREWVHGFISNGRFAAIAEGGPIPLPPCPETDGVRISCAMLTRIPTYREMGRLLRQHQNLLRAREWEYRVDRYEFTATFAPRIIASNHAGLGLEVNAHATDPEWGWAPAAYSLPIPTSRHRSFRRAFGRLVAETNH